MVAGTMGPEPRPWLKAQGARAGPGNCALGQGLGPGPIVPTTIF